MFVFTGIQYIYLDKTRNHSFSQMQQRPKKERTMFTVGEGAFKTSYSNINK